MPPTYPVASAPAMSSSSSSVTSSIGLPLSPYQVPFVDPPPVGQVYPPAGPPPLPYHAPYVAPPPIGQGYPPIGQPPVQHPEPYLLLPAHVAYPPAPWPLYPQAPWVPYLPYYPYQQGGNDEDSETARPDKFTGWDSSKLCPFIICCVMVFDSQPRKFVTDRQQVLYAASHLSDIAMLWWQPNLVLDPKPSICSDWSEFVEQLNIFFVQPYL